MSAANRCSHCGAPRVRHFGGSSTKHNPGCKTLEQVAIVVAKLGAVNLPPAPDACASEWAHMVTRAAVRP